MKELNREELSTCNGKEGKPVYIVHQGKVYDASQSRLWKTGRHMNRHDSGNDLTAEIEAAPHGLEVLERIPQVGVVKAGPTASPLPRFLSGLLARFPLLRRHPHPMVVHFPIVFMIAAPVFQILYLLTGSPSFSATALHTLGGALLTLPVAMATGFLTWWINYLAKPLRPVSVKIKLSFVLLGVAGSAFVWRVAIPGIAGQLAAWPGVLYHILILALFPIVSVIGWFGGQLTFPVGKE
jgi:predicted heme/steroid binding protein/uncharacterized membrane protein